MKRFRINPSILLLLVVIISLASCAEDEGLPKVTHGRLERLTPIKSEYVSDRAVDVWLPDQYDGSTAFPVLYMHDGQMLFDASITWNNQSWEVDSIVQTLIDRNEIEPLIVVGIHNVSSERHSNYFPQEPFERLSKSVQDSLVKLYRNTETPLFSKPINSNDYLSYLTQELIPAIDATYATKKEASGRVLAGSSMGGLISWYATTKYPETFGGAACLSTHWPGVFSNDHNPVPATFIEYLSENAPPADTHKLYFDHGTATLDSLYPIHQKRVDRLLALSGYDTTNYLSRVFEGENHTERAWSKRLHLPLIFFFGKSEQQ